MTADDPHFEFEDVPERPTCRGTGCPFSNQCASKRRGDRAAWAMECWGRRNKDGLWQCERYEPIELEAKP